MTDVFQRSYKHLYVKGPFKQSHTRPQKPDCVRNLSEGSKSNCMDLYLTDRLSSTEAAPNESLLIKRQRCS